jgi:hypothetical protein
VKTVGRASGLAAAVAAMLSVSAVAAAGPARTEGGLLKGAVHADIGKLTANGTTREVTLDRGAVTASTPTSISLERADGQTVTLTVALATKVRGTIAVGTKALVLSRDGTALSIRVRGSFSAPTLHGAAKAGKPHLLRGAVHATIDLIKADGSTDSITYDRGEITAKTSSSITLKRKDGKSVTLATDSSTKVREKRTLATLADLQAGDRAMFFSRDGKAFLIRCITKAKA